MTRDPFGTAQLGTAIGMGGAVLFCLAVVLLGPRLWPWALPQATGLADRLALALRSDLLVLFWLFAGVAEIANRRFFSAADISGAGFGAPSPVIAIPVAVLQNTLEQSVLAIGTHLLLAVVLPDSALVQLPLLAFLFFVGRLAFRLGYRFGGPGRAFGFGTTFYPTVGALVYAALRVADGA